MIEYIHTGLILNEDGKKMSKRDRPNLVRKAIIARIAEVRLEAGDGGADEAEAKLITELVDVCNSGRS